MKRRLSVVLLMLTLAVQISTANAFDDWPQFLGPKRNGISKETGLLKSWPADGLKEVWRVKGGVGNSAVLVVGGKALTMVQRGGTQRLLVLDAKSGKELHSTTLASEYSNSMGNGPRATPAVKDGIAYCFTGEGILAAVDIKTGNVKWKKDVIRETLGRIAEYGMASSPLIIGKNVVVTAGSRRATVAAFDRASGKIAWAAGEDNATGYSSAAVLKVGGREQLVVYSGSSALGVDPTSGKQLWRFPYRTDYDCNIATPLAVNGDVFISSGENHGCALLDLQKSGAGYKVETRWTSFGR